MSINLPVIDLSTAVVGTSGVIFLGNQGLPSDESFAKLRLLNESGCGLSIKTQSEGHSLYVAAGGWMVIDIKPGESGINWSVVYTIPAPPVSSLLSTYYYPGEPVDSVLALGNSPVGGGTTSMGTTLQNVGSPTNTANVIQVSPAGDANNTATLDNMGNLVLGDATNLGSIILNGNLKLNPAIVTVSGQTSGTAQLIQFILGEAKVAIIILSVYKNTSTQLVSIGNAFTGPLTIITPNMHGNIDVMNSVGAVNIDVMNSIAAAGGTINNQSFMAPNSIGFTQNGINKLNLQANSAAASGVIIMIGS